MKPITEEMPVDDADARVTRVPVRIQRAACEQMAIRSRIPHDLTHLMHRLESFGIATGFVPLCFDELHAAI